MSEELAVYKGLSPDMSYTFEKGRELLEQAEAIIAEHIAKATFHQQAIYVSLAFIRYNGLYKYAFDENGERISSWTKYVHTLSWRFNVSQSWLFSRTYSYFIGVMLGFSEEELYELDPLSLDLMKDLMVVDKNTLIINYEQELGISEDDSDDEKLEKARRFVYELNALPPDERVKRVRGDIMGHEKYFFHLRDDFEIVYTSTSDSTERLLREAPNRVVAIFRNKIKDKTFRDSELRQTSESIRAISKTAE